jgi:hypothetical protein
MSTMIQVELSKVMNTGVNSSTMAEASNSQRP